MSAYLQVQSCLAQAQRYAVALGDSRTASKTGVWAGWPVANLAVDGSTSADVLANQVPCLAAGVPTLPGPVWGPLALMLFLDVGINDARQILGGTETLAQFQANALAIVQGILASGVTPPQVLLSSTTPISADNGPTFAPWWTITEDMAGEWQSLASTYGCRYLDLLGAFTNYAYNINNINPALYMPDSSLGSGHYSTAGWQLIDNLMANAINSLGPVVKARPLYSNYER